MAKLPVKRAVSAGGVVYRREGNEIQVALVGRTAKDIWALPKGLVEDGEDVAATATREVAEETGLAVHLVDRLGTLDYWYVDKAAGCRYHKFVHFFLFEATGGDLSHHDWEYDRAAWFPIAAAPGVMSYASEADMVRKAAILLERDVSADG
jgi:8-oxo-dGTP diphosphatase